MNIINIELSIKGIPLAKCSYSKLKLYSATFQREISFHNIYFYEGKNLYSIEYQDTIKVSVNVTKRSGVLSMRRIVFYIIAFDFNIDKHNNLNILGDIGHRDDSYVDYDQNVIDILSGFPNEEAVTSNWLNRSKSYKEAYFAACSVYGDSEYRIKKESNFIIDFSECKDIYDVIFFFSKEILEELSYLARSEYSFEDGLLTLLRTDGLRGKKVTLIYNNSNAYIIERVKLISRFFTPFNIDHSISINGTNLPLTGE